MDQLWLWVGFNAFVLAMLTLDLGVFHRRAHEVSVKEAATWSAVWVALALRIQLRHLPLQGGAGGAGVPRRLPDREGAVGRQYLRLRPDFLLLPGAPEVPAPGLVLGHPRRWSCEGS